MKELVFSFFLTIKWPDYLNWGLAVLGLALAVYLYYLSQRKRIPVYRCKTTRLIQSSVTQIGPLEISYNFKRLNALSISKVVFWNAGKETISNSDIATHDKLRIVIDNRYEILSCEVLKQTKQANNFIATIAPDKKSINISFDYFDYEDGVVLTILHTGLFSSDLEIKGSIKTVKEIRKQPSFTYIGSPVLSRRLPLLSKFGWLLLLLGVFLIVFPPIAVIIDYSEINPSNSIWGQICAILIVLFGVYTGITFLVVFARYRNSVPKPLLDDYASDDF